MSRTEAQHGHRRYDATRWRNPYNEMADNGWQRPTLQSNPTHNPCLSPRYHQERAKWVLKTVETSQSVSSPRGDSGLVNSGKIWLTCTSSRAPARSRTSMRSNRPIFTASIIGVLRVYTLSTWMQGNPCGWQMWAIKRENASSIYWLIHDRGREAFFLETRVYNAFLNPYDRVTMASVDMLIKISRQSHS